MMRADPITKRWIFALALFALGCDAEGGFTDEMPDDFPAGRCDETTTGGEDCETGGEMRGSTSTSGTTGVAEIDCLVEGCVGQAVCVADWDPQSEARGEFECRFACVPLLDDGAWCSGDDSCCDVGARCTERGYCVLEEDGGAGSTGGEGTSSGGPDEGSSGTSTGS